MNKYLIEYVKLSCDPSGLVKMRPTFHTLAFLPGNAENIESLKDLAEELAACGFYDPRQKLQIMPGSIMSIREAK